MRMIRNLSKALLLLLLAAFITAGIFYREQLQAERLAAWVEQAGIAAPLLFVALYALFTVAFFPGAVVPLVGGALFGPVLGTLYNLSGATLGATIAFLLSRYLASEWVMAKAKGRGQQLIEGVESEGWRFVAFVRLVPLFPFNLLNYLLGLTRIPLLHYIFASFFFMLPGAIAYTWLGYVGREAAAGSEGLVRKGLLGLALLALVAFLPRLVARWRLGTMLSVEQLKTRLEDREALLLLDVRTPADYSGEQGHIQGSSNIPLEELKGRLHELNDWRDRPVAIVCRTDRRSAKAACMLAARGFTDVHVVRQGMTAWNAAGGPVVH
jgi:uncharacterized membrane protein YdjX (TVP38/TMEM64 family)/rhodanese-related sulfurtransferase